jgi:hypothetical protein
MTDAQETVEPFFLPREETKHVLGGICETTYWDYVKRGLLPVVHIGRKVVNPYPAVKALAARMAAGELAARRGLPDHATAKSVESRRRNPPKRRQRRSRMMRATREAAST